MADLSLKTREELCVLWPRLDRPLRLLEQWSWPRGILFESDAESGYEAVRSISALLGGHLEMFEHHPTIKDDWRDRAARHIDGKVPPAALYESKKDKMVLGVLDLDCQPEWLQLALKGAMDRSSPSLKALCILATTRDAAELPPQVKSAFHVVRKNGRRRGPMNGGE